MIATRNLHILDGRVRLRTPALKGNQAKATEVETLLLRQSGVTAVKTNTVTGSVLVTFNSRVTHHDEILRLLNYLDCPVDDDDDQNTPTDVVTGYLAKTAVEFALKSLVFGFA